MKFHLLLVVLLVSGVHSPLAAQSTRERLSMNEGWAFRLGSAGDIGENKYLRKSAEGFHAKDGSLRLPHDWARQLRPVRAGYVTNAFKPLGFQFPDSSIGWYGRTFQVPAADGGKRIWLEFDGVFRNAQFWVNAHYLGRHESGYDSFRFEITPQVEPGGKNEIVVRVDASEHEGWWYEGAGIYRNVWLIKTGPIAVAPDGVFVVTKFPRNRPADTATVEAEVSIDNTTNDSSGLVVSSRVLDGEGRELGAASRSIRVPAARRETLTLSIPVANPRLWSPATPELSTLVTTIERDGEVIDQVRTRFGFRTIEFDPGRGFLLNGDPTLIRGVCLHHDHAGVGTAIPRALHLHRLKALKQIGVNAIRMAHNPADPVLMDLCDELGFLVMAENRPFLATPYGLEQLERLVRRDRNHPSVFIWSIGNEEYEQNKPLGQRTARAMVQRVRQLDPTRPTTFANNAGQHRDGVNAEVDVHGWNYGNLALWKDYHARFPGQPTIITEYFTGRGTRGLYVTDRSTGHWSSYGLIAWWRWIEENPWLSGGFLWTGIDYAGETWPAETWPTLHNSFGLLDRCGFRKDMSYYHEARWRTEPVLHLMPHWNWPDKVGQPIEVRAYTNCDEVELSLNGRSLGRQQPKLQGGFEGAMWKVPYAPGRLMARGFRAGQVVMETRLETAGPAAALRVTADRLQIDADGEDLAVVKVEVVDSAGRLVPSAAHPLQFRVTGPGELIGLGNGDPRRDDGEGERECPVYGGLAQAIVQAKSSAGEITLHVDSPGLAPAAVVVTARAASARPFVPHFAPPPSSR